jgi:hypothetical protein
LDKEGSFFIFDDNMLSTFPSPDSDNRYIFPNGFGVSEKTFTAISEQSSVQITQSTRSSYQLTDAANIVTDASLGINFYVTLTASRNMSAPTNPSDWQVIRYYITQNGTGGWNITWNGIFRFSLDVVDPILTATPYFSDYVEFMYNPIYSTWDCLRVVKGFDSTP